MKFQIILLIALSCSVSSRNDDDDESRPYEFGFTIDGQQHRHESKDVNGIVMGEFGFITADGIYHVTVYATDENGNFKILSMRNVRVSGPLDEPGYEFPKKTPGTGQTHEKLIAAPEPQLIVTTTTQAPTTNFKAPYVFTTLPSLNVPACSSCKLPSTTPRPAGQQKDNKFPFQTPAFQDKSHLGGPPQLPPQQSPPQPPQQFPQQFPQQPPQQFPQQFPQQPPQQFPQLPPQQPPKPIQPEYDIDRRYGGLENFDDTNGKLPENYEPIQPSIEQQPPLEKPKTPVFENINNVPNTFRQGKEIAVAEKIQNAPEFTPETNPPIGINPNVDVFQPVKPSLPITVSEKQINIPGRDPIPIKDPYPNMVDGLPAGITENDMLDLLYKFNYTLGFHGHHEKGLKNGAKVGAYFVNGRDGISRVVEYIADENGYRPKVRFINLGLDSPDTPKEGTEKTFGLKGFEFTWYPI